ncbi:MAG TPA: hypothetical protein PKW42_12145, partial [bacterium]|nr:hypothetical protein [bacterium]
MKKEAVVLAATGCLAACCLLLLAQGTSGTFQEEVAAKMRQLREIRQKMAAIEWKAAGQDDVLRKIQEQYRELQKKMQEITQQREERLDVVLKDNAEYQDLKKQYDALR